MRRIGVVLFIFVLCLGVCAVRVTSAQDLAPRAYIITPLHSNAVTLTYSFFDGSVLFEGNVPITGARAQVHVSVFNAYHSFNLLGRTASILM